MSSDTLNDNGAMTPSALDLDAHGQAAVLLVESLIHGLIEESVLSVAKAVEIVDVATDVKREMKTAHGDTPATSERTITLLEAISRSLRHDLPRE